MIHQPLDKLEYIHTQIKHIFTCTEMDERGKQDRGLLGETNLSFREPVCREKEKRREGEKERYIYICQIAFNIHKDVLLW